MNNLVGMMILLMIVCGLYYFWYKCQVFAVSKVTLVMGFLFWPVGVITGVYWAIKDIYVFRKIPLRQEFTGANSEEKTEKSERPVDPDAHYSRKSDEFRKENLDKFSFSALLDEGDLIKKSERAISPANKVNDGERLTLDEAYLQALDEYESKSLDRALYARLLAESEGNEELVKSRYIKLRAENLTKK